MKQTSQFTYGLDFRMAKHTGIGTYLRGIAEGLQREQLLSAQELVLMGGGAGAEFSRIHFDAPIYSLAEQWQYRELVPLCRLWHAPHYNVPFFKYGAKLVVTIHDIIHWVYRSSLTLPQRAYAEVMLRRAIHNADHIITVSENSKKDLVRLLGADGEKISVVYNGVDHEFRPAGSDELEQVRHRLSEKYGVKGPFFLYVGMLKSHKNVLRLMRAFVSLKKRNEIQSGLVIIGQGQPGTPEMDYLNDFSDRIKHLPKTEFGDLKCFYQCATALIHPSLYEGFGLTVLEAMSCGTPVLTTTRASLPEVAGDAAVLVDGEDEAELQSAMICLDGDALIRSKLIEDGLVRACRFSWNKAARETAAVYKKVLER